MGEEAVKEGIQTFLSTPDPLRTRPAKCFLQYEYNKQRQLKFIWIVVNHQAQVKPPQVRHVTAEFDKTVSGHSLWCYELFWSEQRGQFRIEKKMQKLMSNFEPCRGFKFLLPRWD